MEKIKFPWIEDEKFNSNIDHSFKESSNSKLTSHRYYLLLKPYFPYFLIMLVLFIFSQKRGNTPPDTNSEAQRSVATTLLIMSLVEIPKGRPIPHEALDIVEVKTSSLTKTQHMKVFTPEQLSKLTHQIVAKKDIPPHAPIFWSDLQIKSSTENQSQTATKTQIHFSNSSSN